MTARYMIRGFVGYAERDTYENGCEPDSGFCKEVSVDFAGASPADVAAQAADYFASASVADCAELDACDEPGRIDIATLETADGYCADEHDIAAWKEGNKELWYVVYTGFLECVADCAFTEGV